MTIHIAEIGFSFMADQRNIVEIFNHVIEILISFSSFIGVNVGNHTLLARTINTGKFSFLVPFIASRIVAQITKNAGVSVRRPGDSIFLPDFFRSCSCTVEEFVQSEVIRQGDGVGFACNIGINL